MSESIVFKRNLFNNEFLLLSFVLCSGVFSYVFRDGFIDSVTAKVWIVIVLSVLLSFSFFYKLFKFFKSPCNVCFYAFDRVFEIENKKYKFGDLESVSINTNRSSYGFLIKFNNGEKINVRPFYKLQSGSLERLTELDFVSGAK